MENEKSYFAMPNGVSTDYFRLVLHTVSRAKEATYPQIIRQEAITAVIMSVTAVEVFLNVFFRTLVEESEYLHAKDIILNDLARRRTLDRKIKSWPEVVFRKRLDLESDAIKGFFELKDLRNDIVHFTSSYESLEFEQERIQFQGMANTGSYYSLTAETAKNSLLVSCGFVREIFRLKGHSETEIERLLHGWCGFPPDFLSSIEK